MKVLHTLPSYEHPQQVVLMLTEVLSRPAYPLLVLLLLFAGSFSPLAGQQFATLNLTVTDPAGSVIAQANASVRNVDTGVVRTGVSDKLGLTVIPGLPAGQYKLTASAEGFTTYEAPLTLTLGQTADLQIGLRVRAKTEQVEVHDTPEGVDGERTEGSQVINPAQISELPISDRDFIDFVLLTPDGDRRTGFEHRRPVGFSGNRSRDQLRRIARDAQRLLWIGRNQLHNNRLWNPAS